VADFHDQAVISWDEFICFVSSLSKAQWAYRGQEEKNWELRTSLERSLDAWGIDLTKASSIEAKIIRDFRRRYRGSEKARIDADTLYCLSIMQHHGAPTRLLDWTYSPFVAAKFAIEKGPRKENGHKRKPVMWCLNTTWCAAAAADRVKSLSGRSSDRRRNDGTFRAIYMDERRKFVSPENALDLNERLTIQQGLFLCPGDVTSPFVDNLKKLKGWHLRENFVRLHLDLKEDQFRCFASWIRRMNVSSATLFPGMDGFARSIGEHIFHYQW
jgi:hypothetical protein